MAGVDVGTSGGKRATNMEINMVPFIDLLMVTIAFLLITAVWVTSSRVDAAANVPGRDDEKPVDPAQLDRTLELRVGEAEFTLVWKQGATVISESKVPREASSDGGPVRHAALAARIGEEWRQNGSHRDPSDRAPDRAALRVDDRTPFKDVVAVMDAIYATTREYRGDGGAALRPAFQVVFATR